jgi:uncharacterized membrane protein (UPF0182 family)
MQGDNMSYGDTLDDALEGLFGEAGSRMDMSGSEATRPPERTLAIEASDAFERYLDAQGDGRFQDAAAALERLQSALSRLSAGDNDVGDPQNAGATR